MENVIHLHDVHRTYSMGKVEVKAVCGISLDIGKGKFVSFVGPSGCGKTTLLNMIGCIDVPSRGTVNIEGQDMAVLRDNKLTQFRGKSIGFIFQTFNLVPVLNIIENIAYPLRLMRVPKDEIKKKVTSLVEYVGLGDFIHHKPNQLSGGQRQRVAIARALVIDPKIVIADEPTANLDSQSSEKIMQLMMDLQRKLHTTFVFATHDPRHLDKVDTIYEMKDGRVVNEK